MALSKQNRLRSSRDFGTVHRRGVRAATRHLAVRALKPKAAKPGAIKTGAIKTEAIKTRAIETGAIEIRSPKLRATEPEESATRRSPQPIHQPTNPTSADGNPSALVSSFGISISRKVSKRAVVRNRIKRQIKAIIRRFLPEITPGWQVVIVVRPAAVECEFDDFLRELNYLLKKLEIFT